MRDGVGFEKANAVANDTKSATTTWRDLNPRPRHGALRPRGLPRRMAPLAPGPSGRNRSGMPTKRPRFCSPSDKKRKPVKRQAFFFWSEWRDLNPRPLGPEPSTLPTALHPGAPAKQNYMVIREKSQGFFLAGEKFFPDHPTCHLARNREIG